MLVKIYEDDNIIVDYDKTNKKYRVSIFKDYHFQDEFWFDAYEEKDNVQYRSLQEVINKLCAVPLVNPVSSEELKMAMEIFKEGTLNNC